MPVIQWPENLDSTQLQVEVISLSGPKPAAGKLKGLSRSRWGAWPAGGAWYQSKLGEKLRLNCPLGF